MIYVRNKKTKANEPGWWPDKKRLEVLTTYLATGSPTLTCAMTGIPIDTFKNWKKQDWWKDQMNEIQQGEALQLDKKLQKLMDKSLDAVMDRVENGEYMIDPRTGQTKRVPAKLRDVQRVASETMDKRMLLDKRLNGDKEKESKQQITADHLVQLAREFAKFANPNFKEEPEISSVIEGDHEEIFEALDLETTNSEIAEGLKGGDDTNGSEESSSGLQGSTS